MSVYLPSAARTLTDENEAFRRLSDNHGIDRRLSSERLHSIKRENHLGGMDDVLFDLTGGVWDPKTHEFLGSLSAGGKRRGFGGAS
jgi:hypothetical protein